MTEAERADDHLSPQEMRAWLAQEIADSAKAFELRVKEAAEIVSAYALGEISPGEAETRLQRYDRRWGEALYGASAAVGVTDEALVNQIDMARKQTAEGHAQRFAKRKPPEMER